jgi:NAD(P)-dependent dehydrogenase (short-subunit alcohol dehydrogenase family)
MSTFVDLRRVDHLYAGARLLPCVRDERVTDFTFDLLDERSIATAAQRISSEGSLDLVIVTTGGLQFHGKRTERSWQDLELASLEAAFAVNTTGPTLIAKHFMPLMRRDSQAVFAALPAKVGSIEDNRLGRWHGYRASKAALNQIVRNLATEFRRKNPQGTAVTLHSGTVDTELSQPFASRTPPRRLFSPYECAAKLLRVLGGLLPADSGHMVGWDGSQIPFRGGEVDHRALSTPDDGSLAAFQRAASEHISLSLRRGGRA